MLGDHVRVYRVKNLVKTAQKTKRILEEAGLHPQEVPGRVLLPILDTCSLENDDSPTTILRVLPQPISQGWLIVGVNQ